MTQAQTLMHKVVRLWARPWAPPIRRSVALWAEEKRFLSDKNSAFPGQFRLSLTPFLREVLDALNDPLVREVDAQKSAQIGWTDGVLCNWLGCIIDEQPAGSMVLFPADKKGKEFNSEKFEPMVEATPVLSAKLVTKSRTRENRQDYKDFVGGFLKFVGSNSPMNLKSTTAKNLAVEEPDDCNLNIKGQGDSITMLEERGKRYPDRKLLVGGTPSIEGVSAIAERMKLSDQRHWMVPCHHCGEAQSLKWGQVKWSSDPGRNHPVYGNEMPETARYVCEHCGVEWSDLERVANVRRADDLQRQGVAGFGWVATAEFRGRAGFYFNELMSVFPGSELASLAEKYLSARHAMESEGDITKMIVFRNQTEGLTWEYKGTTAQPEVLLQRVEDYPEWFVPWAGLIITVGVDVQHDRLAVVVRAWGEGEESWLIWAGELYGNVLEAAVWDELDSTVVFRSYRHMSGVHLNVSAVSVDSSDGSTTDAVYKYCRRANSRFGVQRALPIKGSTNAEAEIFRKPGAALDVDAQHKGAKYGLRPYMVGVSRAKDLILGAEEKAGRINLRDSDGKTGRGPGRIHWYRGLRGDYFAQLTAEVKAPARDLNGRKKMKKVWQRKAGKPNEFLDCEVYALHAARALRMDTYTSAHWTVLRERFLQGQLFEPAQENEAIASVAGSAGLTDAHDAATAQPEQSPKPVPMGTPSAALAAREIQKSQHTGRRVRSAGLRT